MSGELVMRRKGDTLVLTSPVFLDDLRAIPEGVDVVVTAHDDRNPAQLAWYWAMLSAICRSGAFDGDKDELDDFVRLGVGFGKWRPISDGRAVFIPNTIRISRCNGRRFTRFLWYVERFLAERLGIDTAQVFAAADREAGPLDPAEERRAA